ncbi:MAG TPA: zf-HC2 domain-containing protein [Mycobacteriales bacterium]|nr:zf-HC2 domain-containing protein [Mycobacteriales bacterium]
MSRPCLGERLTALVDGALGHDERERVHAHLAGCPVCRAELDAQRALKARLAGLAAAAPAPPPSLLAALQGLAVPGADPLAPHPAPVPRPAAVGAPPAARAAVRPGAPRTAAGPGRAPLRRLRRATVGSGLAALGVGAVLALGSGGATSASTPVDPGSPSFVVDFVSTTSVVPLADPAGAAPAVPSMASVTSVSAPATLPRR